jgi:hypothetical protein
MHESKVEDHVRQHADAVVRGDMDAVVGDFAEALQPRVPELAQDLPQPVESADVLEVDVGNSETSSTMRRGPRRGTAMS